MTGHWKNLADRILTWMTNHPRWIPWISVAVAVFGTAMHVLSGLGALGWWGLPLDIFSALMLVALGALVAGGFVIEAYLEDLKQEHDVWINPDNITPGPSAELYIDNGHVLVDPAVISPGNYEPTHASDEPTDEFGTNYPVLAEIHEEVLTQIDVWGEQNHPNGTGGSTAKLNRTNAKKAVEAAVAAGDGSLTWALILKEEFTEAMAEEDLEKLDRELTQIAAVCASWKAAIARQMAAAIGVEANPQ